MHYENNNRMRSFAYLLILAILSVQCADNHSPHTTATQETGKLETYEPKTDDEQAIAEVIGNYFDGWLTGDTTLVGSAMHSTCHLKFVREDKIAQRNRKQYLSGFKPRPRLPEGEGRIISIDVTGTAAAAKIELETADRIFTDYFNLLIEEGRWYIVDKVSSNVAK